MISPLHLAIDSSASRPVVALMRGEECIAEWVGPGDLKHHETLLSGVDECIKKSGFALSDLGYISIGVGPGLFTGLRIGVITAKFLADPFNLRCVPVSSLLALGWQSNEVGKGHRVWSIGDAKAKRVYALPLENFSPDFSSSDSEAIAVTPEEAATKMKAGDVLVGEGALLYRSLWPAGTTLVADDLHTLKASSVGALGAKRFALALTCSATELEPTYLKTGQPHL